MRRLDLLAFAALLCLAGAAEAQPALAPQPRPRTDFDDRHGTLSDKLGGTGGVIAPPGDVDPAMHKPTPQNGATPLIDPGHVPRQSGDGAAGTGGLY